MLVRHRIHSSIQVENLINALTRGKEKKERIGVIIATIIAPLVPAAIKFANEFMTDINITMVQEELWKIDLFVCGILMGFTCIIFLKERLWYYENQLVKDLIAISIFENFEPNEKINGHSKRKAMI